MQKAKIGARAMTMSVVLVLFACGGGGGTSEPTAPTPTAPAPTAPAPTVVEPPAPAPGPGSAGKERTCPDAWYFNAMPGTIPDQGSPPREYLVVGGQRREIAEFDVDWIKANCPVNKPQTVH
jgi:hypothetical protein